MSRNTSLGVQVAEMRFIFETVTRLTAGALGVPGKRTFYLLVGRGETLVRLWMEKEQLQMLGAAVERLGVMLQKITPSSPPAEEPSALAPSPGEPLAGDIQGGRLALGYDQDRDMLLLLAHERDAEEDAPPALGCWASFNQMRALGLRIDEVCAAGRPLCPLCAGPIDPEGHTCPRKNGHHTLDMLGPEERPG